MPLAPSSFTASAISITPVDGVLTIAFLEKPSGEGRYLLLQRDLHATDAAKSGDYLELDGKSTRLGIESVQTHAGRLRFNLNEEGRYELGTIAVCVSHELKLNELGRLYATIRRIVGDEQLHHMPPSIQEVNSMLEVEGEDGDAYGEFSLFVPAFGRSLPVHIDLADGSTINAASSAIIADLVGMSEATRKKITHLLYEHAQVTARQVVFPDPTYDASKAPSFVSRLIGLGGKRRVVALSLDDPIHPCFLEHGIDSVEKKVEWTGFRISEGGRARNRMCVLDCRPKWEQENGLSIIIRNGEAVAIVDTDVNVDDFEQSALA